MQKENERTKVMKEKFMALHQDGFTIPEIAEKCGVSKATIYRHLAEIAKANGFKSREDLLQFVKSPSEKRLMRQEREKTRVDVEEMRAKFHEARQAIKSLTEIVDEILKEDE